ncbi:uncharacterized protein LOC124157947 [Ischnura elegans]|uniref:uncharacterized protein LOC124157947 n=1 Tax=Ischnura elegans TaxID=197161 RepID=UPI001ED88D5A|nr:uncharacterized protein LOC124157947 [Ischnura elegans]
MSWNRTQVDTLIHLVRERPYLFDPRNSLYKNKGKRMSGFREIAEEMSPSRPNTIADDCKKKWYSLRTTYLAERRKVASSKKSGLGAEAVYVPSLFYYHDIKFIDEYTSPRKSTSTLNTEAEELPAYDEEIPVLEEWELEDVVAGPTMDVVFVEDEARPASASPMSQGSSDPATPGTSGSAKKRKRPTSDEASTLLTNATQALGSLTSRMAPVEDLEGNFAKTIASKLRLIQDKERKNKIMFELWKVFHDNEE